MLIDKTPYEAVLTKPYLIWTSWEKKNNIRKKSLMKHSSAKHGITAITAAYYLYAYHWRLNLGEKRPDLSDRGLTAWINFILED